MAQDPNFPRIEAAGEIGLRSALAFPVLLGDEVLGVIEFFNRRVQQPDADLLRAMTVIGGQIGQFIDRKQAEQERIRLLAREHVARAESEAAQQRFAFLAEASAALAASLDYEAALARVVGLAVPYLADWCAVDVVEDGGALRRLAIAHADTTKAEWALALEERYPTSTNAAIGAPAVVRTGEPSVGAGNHRHDTARGGARRGAPVVAPGARAALGATCACR